MRIIMNYEICILIARNAGHSKPDLYGTFHLSLASECLRHVTCVRNSQFAEMTSTIAERNHRPYVLRLN